MSKSKNSNSIKSSLPWVQNVAAESSDSMDVENSDPMDIENLLEEDRLQPEFESSVNVEQRSSKEVIVVIPHDFILRLDNHKEIKFKTGTQKIPLEYAEHWYSIANGVEIFKE